MRAIFSLFTETAYMVLCPPQDKTQYLTTGFILRNHFRSKFKKMKDTISGKDYFNSELNGWSDIRKKKLENLADKFQNNKFTLEQGDRVVCIHSLDTFSKGKVYVSSGGNSLYDNTGRSVTLNEVTLSDCFVKLT